MQRALLFTVLVAVFSGICGAVVACGERCQVNDPRSECNAYGAPDKYKDANIVTSSDASPE